MYKVLAIAAVILGVAGLSQAAPIFSVDLENSGLTQPGFESWVVSGTGSPNPVSFTTASGHQITLTPSGVGPATAFNISSKDKTTDPDYAASPMRLAMGDYVRVQPDPWYADPIGADTPTMTVEIDNLAANTAYTVHSGNMNPYRNTYAVISPTNGTTGAVLHWAPLNPPAMTADPLDKTYDLDYTSNAEGLLTYDITWDKAAWMLDEGLYPHTAENEVEVAFIQLIPEPATMSLLALGGLMAIRRRR